MVQETTGPERALFFFVLSDLPLGQRWMSTDAHKRHRPLRDRSSLPVTVPVMSDAQLPSSLADVLVRVESLRNGLAAAASLPAVEACAEAVLLFDEALRRCNAVLLVPDREGLSRGDVRLLVTAERHWLEVLRDMLVADQELPADVRLARVLASFPC